MSGDQRRVLFRVGAQLDFGFLSDTDVLKYTITHDGIRMLVKVLRNPEGKEYIGYPKFGISALAAQSMNPQLTDELNERTLHASERRSDDDLINDVQVGQGGDFQHNASEELLKFSSATNRQLYEAVKRVARLLRWRGNGDGGHEPVRRVSRLQFSMDRKNWYAAPSKFQLVTFGRELSVFHSRAHSDVELMLSDPLSDEPLGHNLIREAESMIFDNPRSAIVMALASLETAVKTFISDADHVAEWFVEEKRVPQMEKLLLHLLPKISPYIPASSNVDMIPKDLRKSIKSAEEARNEIVHRSKRAVSVLDAKEYVEAVRNALWLLDYYSGLDWARDFVDDGILVPQVIPNPNPDRSTK
jgi:6-pyruvoyl-tetrahydropterin synthase